MNTGVNTGVKSRVLVLVIALVSGLAVLGLALPASAGLVTLATSGTPDSFQNTDGLGGFFDLTAIKTVTVNSFDFYTDADANAPFKMDLFSRPGASAGHTGSSLGWTLEQSLSGTSDGMATPHNMSLTTPLTISAGSTVGLYLRGTTGGMRWIDEGSPATTSDANLTLSTSSGNVNFDDTTLDSFKSLAFNVSYTMASAPPPPPPPTGIPLPNSGWCGLALLGFLGLALRRWGVRLA